MNFSIDIGIFRKSGIPSGRFENLSDVSYSWDRIVRALEDWAIQELSTISAYRFSGQSSCLSTTMDTCLSGTA